MKLITQNGYVINISINNRKMGSIPSFSLPPIKTCSPSACKQCGKKCYAQRHMYGLHKTVKNAWDENLNAVENDLQGVEQALNGYFNTLTAPRFFRVHVGGDFVNKAYFEMWVRIAATHPNTNFLAFTKYFDNVTAEKLPDNFSLVCSSWAGVEIPEKLNSLPVAHCRQKGESVSPDLLPCNGNCDTCGVCWSLGKIIKEQNTYKGVYFDEH